MRDGFDQRLQDIANAYGKCVGIDSAGVMYFGRSKERTLPPLDPPYAFDWRLSLHEPEVKIEPGTPVAVWENGAEDREWYIHLFVKRTTEGKYTCAYGNFEDEPWDNCIPYDVKTMWGKKRSEWGK